MDCAQRVTEWNDLLTEGNRVVTARIDELTSIQDDVAKYRSTIVTNSTLCREFLLGLKDVKGEKEFVPLTGDRVRCFFRGEDGRTLLFLSVNMDGFTVLLHSDSKKLGYAVRDNQLARAILQFARGAASGSGSDVEEALKEALRRP